MTVTELIEKLKAFDPDAPVYVMGGMDCDMPCEPELSMVSSGSYAGVHL